VSTRQWRYLFKQLVGKRKRKVTVLHQQQLLEQVKVFIDAQIFNEVRHDSTINQRYPKKKKKKLTLLKVTLTLNVTAKSLLELSLTQMDLFHDVTQHQQSSNKQLAPWHTFLYKNWQVWDPIFSCVQMILNSA